ncbi:MAG: hypothetical protein SGCHY_003634 [Lobulomycetales sp.]
MEISSPYNPIHLTHVGYNQDSGEFTGLPAQWHSLLSQSGISKQDQQANPQAVIDIIGFLSVQNAAKNSGEDKNDVWNKFNHKAISEKLEKDSPPAPVPAPEEKKRPVVPRRPAHTMSIYSTDIKSSVVKQPATEENLGSVDSMISLPQMPDRPVPSKTESPLVAAEPVVAPKAEPVSTAGEAALRPRPKPAGITVDEVVAKLSSVCNPLDPTKLYKNLQKVGQGASGGVFVAKYIKTGESVAIKQMNLEQQPKKELIINEILVMREARHKNIVNFMDSFLWKGDLWVVMEYMEGGSLTDIVTSNFMTEGQIAAVCKEVLEGLQHLHARSIIHRDIKSDNILLGINGEIKISE